MLVRRLSTISLISIASVFAFNSPALTVVPNPLFAVLLGGNEVSAAGVANVGDPDGIGSASVTIVVNTVNPALNRLCFGLTVANIANPTAAHIHRANAGINGPVVVPLVPIPAVGVHGASGGCLNGVSTLILQQIQSNPSLFYVNVHNAAFPAGAIRGQLF